MGSLSDGSRPSQLALSFTAAAILLAPIGQLVSIPVLTYIASGAAIIGAIMQYLTATPFVRDFLETDWIQTGSDYQLSVAASSHGRGRGASPKVYTYDGVNYEAVMCGEAEDARGNSLITATKPFRGRIVLR